VLFYRGARRGGHAKSQRFGGDDDFHPERKSGSVTTEMEDDAGMWLHRSDTEEVGLLGQIESKGWRALREVGLLLLAPEHGRE
jgi:hypothetical protein